MIGNPTNFVHTGAAITEQLMESLIESLIEIFSVSGHIGSNDAEPMMSSQHLNAIQNQMQSKGGYDINSIRIQVRHH